MNERETRIAGVGYDPAREPRTHLAHCPLCAAGDLVQITERDRYGYEQPSDLCRVCGLVFLNPVMTGDAYGRFYDGVYRPLVSAYHGRLIDAGSIIGEQEEYARDVAAWIERTGGGRPVTRILDIGGSTGVVAHELVRATGASATVIDPAPPEIERAKAMGLDTVTGFVETWDAAGQTFDLVLLCQTIDHLLDPRAVLERVRDLLTPGGLFFVDIVEFRAGRAKAGSTQGATKVDHPFAFTEETAERALRASGLRVLGKDRAGDGLHVRYVCEPGTPEPGALRGPDSAAALERELAAA